MTGAPVRGSVTLWNLTKWKLPYYDSGDGTESKPFEKKESFASNLFRHMVFGVDFTPGDRFYVSLGYNYKTRTGMNVNRFNFGIAFGQPHSGATTLMFNLNMNLQDILR